MLYACRFNPAPWYVDHWQDDWPEHEPRTPNWNMTAAQRAGHHGAPGNNALLTDEASDVITGIFKNRWRTLMSVDDVVAAVLAADRAPVHGADGRRVGHARRGGRRGRREHGALALGGALVLARGLSLPNGAD